MSTIFLIAIPYGTALTTATWGLVVATSLLAVAAAIPAVRALIEARNDARGQAALLVPDMHILRSRLNGQIADLQRSRSASTEVVESYAEEAEEQLGMLAPLVAAAPHQGLQFTNELYICRHLLTQAMYDLRNSADESSESIGDKGIVHQTSLERPLHLHVAAKTSLNAAEALLPRGARTISGESFWERFARLSDQREADAAAELRRGEGA